MTNTKLGCIWRDGCNQFDVCQQAGCCQGLRANREKAEPVPSKTMLQGAHPRSSRDSRSELELCLRDAFAAGCEAASQRSLVTAAVYAHREAPIVADRLRAAHEPPAECDGCEQYAVMHAEIALALDIHDETDAHGLQELILKKLRAAQPPAAGQSAHDFPPPWHGKRVYIVPVDLQNGGEASTEAVFRACGITFWVDDTSPPTKGENHG